MFVIDAGPNMRATLHAFQVEILAALAQCEAELRPPTQWGFNRPTALAGQAMRTWFGVPYDFAPPLPMTAPPPLPPGSAPSAITPPPPPLPGPPSSSSPSSASPAPSPTAALVLASVQRMHGVLRSRDVRLKYNPIGDFQGRMLGHDRSLELGTEWLRMPDYSFGGPSAWRGGDKFECLVHELSHHALDTRDIQNNKTGQMAYGGTLCRGLATGNPRLAFENADNWGFFIEEFCRYQTASTGGRTRSGWPVSPPDSKSP